MLLLDVKGLSMYIQKTSVFLATKETTKEVLVSYAFASFSCFFYKKSSNFYCRWMPLVWRQYG
jgi:hypothetical protein